MNTMKFLLSKLNPIRNFFDSAIFLIYIATASVAFSADISSSGNFFQDWLTQTNGATAGWFGLDQPLKTYGFSVTGEAKELYSGQLSGGLPNQSKSNWDGEVKLKLQYDFEPIFGLKGLTAESNWRDRFGGQPQLAAGTYNLFNPTVLSGNQGVRIMTQQIEYNSPNKAFMINLGWENPYEQFLQQPLSKFFENNNITQAKGIGGQAGAGIPVYSSQTGKYVSYATSPTPWNSAYAAWGGTLRVKPLKNTYIQSGLYLAISGTAAVTSSPYSVTDVYPYTSVSGNYLGQLKPSGYNNTVNTINGKGQANGTGGTGKYVATPYTSHGFNFQGAPSFNPNGYGGGYSQNGLYNVNEIGWTPKFGTSQLEGKYAIGSYIWGQNNTSFTPTTWVNGQKKPTAFSQNSTTWGLYLQADQQLFREKSDDPAKPSKQGLYSFNEFTFTPPQNNALPFYFQTGLVYKGLIPHRDEDSVGVALGAGFYSSYYNQYIDSQNQALENAYGSTYNAIVPNGPAYVQNVNATTGQPATTTTGTGRNKKTVPAYTSYYEYAPHFSSTEVIEGFYNIQLTKWASLKPGVQYLINPAGNGTIGNEWILQMVAKVAF